MTPNSYAQPTPRSCGPAALSFALYKTHTKYFPSWEIAYEHVVAKWPGGWKDRDNTLDDINDWPDDHRRVIESLGYGLNQHMVTVKDILESRYPPCSVVCLIHAQDTHMAKHWVVIGEVSETTVFLHWGDGKIHSASHEGFILLFTRSFPNCAYTILSVEPELSRWQRFRRWFLGILARFT